MTWTFSRIGLRVTHTWFKPSLMFNLSAKEGSKSGATTVIATPGGGPDRPQEISYTDTKVIGNGSFGVVYQARLTTTGEMVAIKRVLQDKRFKNRELQIMRRLDHCNIVKLKYYFYTSGEKVCWGENKTWKMVVLHVSRFLSRKCLFPASSLICVTSHSLIINFLLSDQDDDDDDGECWILMNNCFVSRFELNRRTKYTWTWC